MADYQEALDALTCLGEGCGCAWHELPGRVADIRTALVVEPLRWIMALCPKWVLLEQVPEIEFLWEDLAAELFAFGYQWVDVRVLDAADYGCISHRRRAVLMAHADCALFPEPLFGPGCRNPHRTPGSVLGLHGTLGFARRNDRPDGGLYRARDMRTTERPAFTVTEKIRSWSYVPADGSARRRLTLSEVAQMQSFPADYPFQGSWTRACLQAANAMPPLLAAQLIAGARYDQFDVEAAVGITPEPVSEPESPPAMPVALTLF